MYLVCTGFESLYVWILQVASGGNGRVYKCITTAANMPELRPEDVLADSGVQWNNPNPQPVPEGQDEQGPHPLEGSPEDEFERVSVCDVTHIYTDRHAHIYTHTMRHQTETKRERVREKHS